MAAAQDGVAQRQELWTTQTRRHVAKQSRRRGNRQPKVHLCIRQREGTNVPDHAAMARGSSLRRHGDVNRVATFRDRQLQQLSHGLMAEDHRLVDGEQRGTTSIDQRGAVTHAMDAMER